MASGITVGGGPGLPAGAAAEGQEELHRQRRIGAGGACFRPVRGCVASKPCRARARGFTLPVCQPLVCVLAEKIA